MRSGISISHALTSLPFLLVYLPPPSLRVLSVLRGGFGAISRLHSSQVSLECFWIKGRWRDGETGRKRESKRKREGSIHYVTPHLSEQSRWWALSGARRFTVLQLGKKKKPMCVCIRVCIWERERERRKEREFVVNYTVIVIRARVIHPSPSPAPFSLWNLSVFLFYFFVPPRTRTHSVLSFFSSILSTHAFVPRSAHPPRDGQINLFLPSNSIVFQNGAVSHQDIGV